jgi:hypothetical protein
MTVIVDREIKVADEVWVATALLHKENPSQPDFSVEEIMARARKEAMTESLRPGVYLHAQMHCVANRPPNPGRYRMLLESSRGRRRLFRPGDRYDSHRAGAKTVPLLEELPEKYRPLLAWYQKWISSETTPPKSRFDALLSLRGSGRDLWANEHADEYVRRLREGWQ